MRHISEKIVHCSRCGKTMEVWATNNSHRHICWSCPRICSICGEDFRSKRREYRCNRCLALKRREHSRTVGGQYTTARNVARQKSLEFTLTFDQFQLLRSLPCTYCGFPLPPTGAGLDRIDNQQGYLIGNVVPCCTECNLARCNLFSSEEMHIIGRAIAEVKTKRQAEGTQAPKGYGRGRDPIY